MSISQYFPLAEAREKQVKALQFIEQRHSEGFQDIVIAAPTGIGKSGIGAAAAYWSKDLPYDGSDETSPGGYYLVTQKLLQDQLAAEMRRYKAGCNDGQLIKAADEYSCPNFSNCGVGGRSKPPCSCRMEGSCEYRVQKSLFLGARLAVTNYAYFFAERLYAGELKNRQVLIADECHTLSDNIMRFVDGGVTTEELKKYTNLDIMPTIDTLDGYIVWLEQEYLPQAKDMLAMYLDIHELDDKKNKEIVDLDKHVCKLQRAIVSATSDPDNWVFWQDENDKGELASLLKPISAAPFTQELILDAAPLRIYLSAYPGTREVFCRDLGLNPSNVAWMSLGSSFAVENRKVVFKGMGSMSLANKQETSPALLKAITVIASKHKTRGLIHCHSYELGNKIFEALERSSERGRAVFPKSADEREEAFEAHAARDNSIIISPSMTEGFDFADDLARWQIVAKTPWPFVGDKQVQARMAKDYDWYLMKTAMTVIQACGRICRSDNDYGVTYVLDSDFKTLWDKASGMFPSWFAKAVQW